MRFLMKNSKYRQVWQEIADSIIEDILNGHYQPEERLKETQLAEKYDTSNTPVREALRYLERVGFVTIRPRIGAIVKGISEKEIRDLVAVQCVLEEFAVTESVNNLRKNDIEKLKQCVEKIEKYFNKRNYAAYEKANVDFHSTIWRASKNKELIELLNSIYMKSQRISVFSRKSPNWNRDVIGLHWNILNAVIDRDGKKTGELIRNGLEKYLDEIMLIMDK